jgi:acyl-CoA dehydrogenase
MTILDSGSIAGLPPEPRAEPCHADISGDLAARAQAVASVAAANAAAVDRDARFPEEAMAAVRAHRLLGIAVPRRIGGEGARLGEIIDICYRLGRACSSTAMIYAMHQIKIACILRHSHGSPWHEQLLRRVCAGQLLLASSTTEGQSGGNVRSSEAAIERAGDRISLERRATVISYGESADGIVTTARRAADAPATDQVLVAFLKDDYSLERIVGWDTLGMRGTCSAGFTLRASAGAEQVLPDPYEKIHAQTMVPVAHLCWSSVWAGITAGAVERAQGFIRGAARQANGQLPPGAAHFTKATSSLRTLRGVIAAALRRYEAAADDERALAGFDFQTMINMTKVETSELAVATVMSALRACGLSGYRNDGESSLSRALRDVLSAPLMINNDRILANIGTASLLSAVPAGVQD